MTLETKSSLLLTSDQSMTYKDTKLEGFQRKLNDAITDTNKQQVNLSAFNQLPDDKPSTSIIAILRRHTMYDSLILVKKYRPGLGDVLEFPTSTKAISRRSSIKNNIENNNLSEILECRERLVTIYLDGDDPMLTYEAESKGLDLNDADIVHVPLNGLRTRLENYEKAGLLVDICVQAYAIGLKNAERFFRSSSMKEIQETP